MKIIIPLIVAVSIVLFILFASDTAKQNAVTLLISYIPRISDEKVTSNPCVHPEEIDNPEAKLETIPETELKKCMQGSIILEDIQREHDCIDKINAKYAYEKNIPRTLTVELGTNTLCNVSSGSKKTLYIFNNPLFSFTF